MPKIGIYSGTFDPIHHGHVAFARHAARQLGLSRVYFMVEPQPRRKAQVTDSLHRLNMAWLATQAHPELELLNLEQPTFSVADTLPWLQEQYPGDELYLLLGSDVFNVVHTWRGFDRLRSAIQFVVGYREGANALGAVQQVPHHVITTPLAGLSSQAIRTSSPEQQQTMVPYTVAQYIRAHQLYDALGV